MALCAKDGIHELKSGLLPTTWSLQGSGIEFFSML